MDQSNLITFQVNFNDKNKNDTFRAKKIGIVYQQNNLLPDFTALENLYLASLSINDNKKMAMLKAKKLLKKLVYQVDLIIFHHSCLVVSPKE